MATIQRTFAVALTIPDNEAFTARETLRRLGIAVGEVRRSTIWTFAVRSEFAAALPATLATLETIFNPNKHELVERTGSQPRPGEVWIAPSDETAAPIAGGSSLEGVERIDRRTAWQLFDEAGSIVEPAVLDRAVETFLCNPAFQKAIR
jgi:hypothetical protein